MNDDRNAPLAEADVDARIASLPPGKRALLLERLSRTRADPPIARVLRPGPDERGFELSFAQQRLWFLEQWEGGGALYNVAQGWWLEGPLEVERLRGAFAQLVSRHESLRTALVSEHGEPRQRVLDEVAVGLEVVDLSALPLEQARAEAQARAQVLARRGFDLAQPPLLRVAVYRVGEHTHLLALVIHHIVADGWSLGVLWRELGACYAGQGEALPALPVQYADYAQWQRAQLQGAGLERQLGYWRSRLAELTTLEFPTDRARPPAQSYRGARHALSLSPQLGAAIRQLSQRERVTPYMLLLAAFQALLARYSGQDDIAVGSPIAGRNRSELEGLIGFFVNTLVLRTDVSGNPRFSELLARVRETALAAYAHQDVPFEKLVEELKPERDPSRNPLIQVMFALQNAPGGELALPGLSVTRQALDTATAKFDLTLTLTEGPDGLHGDLTYVTDLFDAATIERLAGHFTALLEGIVADPGTPVAELPLLGAAERHQLLVQWNDSAADYPREQCIHQLFEQQVARTPQAVAVVFEDERVTYAELNARANRLAHHLIGLGVGPEVLVGICLERSVELVVGLLAILKAGGAYVPLDPQLPTERLAFILEDSEARILVTQRSLLARLPEQEETVCLDRDEASIATCPDGNPEPAVRPSSLAYLIYTSGSTGKPKGVAIAHAALVNFVWSMRAQPGCHAQDVLLSVTTVSFDIAGLEIYLPLIAGARVVVANRDVAADGLRLRTYIEHIHPTLMQATPATWRMLIDAGWTGSPEMTALCGGESLPRELADALSARTALAWNMYGPSETTVWSTAARLSSGTARPTIGRPIANTQAYVLDAQRQPVPVGVAGELYIGGDGVARGYWRRPELTAERFVADPFGAQEGGSLYRTGDRVRYLADGSIEFLGRLDTQVKLRGYRIEPGEIEAALTQQGQVRDAVVVVREDAPGDRRLVAYVVAQGATLEVADLRAALKRQLPDYMIPAAFVELAALPLTPNGKIDRKALPAPEYGPGAVSSSLPRTPVEEAVAGQWCELLHLREVGVHDDFFELGGHSLLAMQMLSWLRDVFGIELSVRTLFDGPTIAELAGRIDEQLAGADKARARPVQALLRTAPLPLSFAQQRLWFLEQWEGGSALYNVAQGWWLEGPLEVERLRGAFAQVVSRHESLRTALVSEHGEPRQRVLDEVAVGLEVVDLSALPLEQARAEAQARAQVLARRGFDLAQPPLLRVAVYRVSESAHLLALVIHHVVSDGWSMGVLWRELGACYAGQGEALPPLAVQYPDYAQWQRAQLQGATLERQLGYWRSRLAELTTLELPTDRARPPAQSYRGARHALALSPELSAALRQLSQRERVTPYMLLLAALQVLLARYSGQDDIAVGSPIAGRNRSELEGLIGFFVNTLVLRTDVSGNPRFRELLARVRETALAAYAHQDVPFEKLVEELKPERDPSRNPLIQVMFALQNAPGGELALPGLSVTRQGLDTATAKFDLTLTLTEGPDGLHGDLTYVTDLFDAATIERLVGHFTALLEGIVADPGTPVAELPLLGAAERHQLLVQWNDSAADYPREQCIHQLFEQQVARTPQAVAVVFEDERVTYAELNARANRLAHHLIGLGVGPEVLVGICLERSVELVVGLLAILKAGGAYLPLDPGYPAERLAFMLEDTRAPVVLTCSGLAERLPPGAASVLCFDSGSRAWQECAETDPPPRGSAADLAYVMYTSGTTGTPKGVMVAHRCIARLVCNTNHVRLGATDVVAQVSNPAFDAATFEVWGALVNGARLLVISRRVALDPALLAEALERGGVSTLFLTTALFNEVIRARPSAFAGLRQVLFGGEAVDAQRVRECLQAGGAQRLVHVYGPTETTTFATWQVVATVAPGRRTIPIGRPLANTSVYVLDGHRQPVPVGVAGELYIGGDGVARGYWRRPELTAERFVPDPFGAQEGGRLYRTGDRVRYLADGSIEFLGRLDTQVKLRGFRIEPGEIEAALTQQGQVRDAVVVVREDAPGDRRLVAYVVAQGATLEVAELRAALKRQLPDYMIPAAFVELAALPLTPNGKIDRKALPAPSAERGTDGLQSAMLQDNIARHLARMWEILLKRDSIGPRDNFFDLGGNSLLAVQLMDQIEKTFQRRLPLDTLWFRGGTVEALAALVRDEYRSGPNPELVAIKGGGRRPLFVVHTMGGNLFHYYELSRHFDPDQPVYGLQARGVFGTGQPDRSIAAIAAHCLQSMRIAQPAGPYMIAGFSSGGVVAYEMAQQLSAAGEQVALLALLDTFAPQATMAKPLIKELAGLLRGRSNLRQLQERVYFSVLHTMRLERWRKLGTVGEAHRWAHWSYRPRPYPQPVELFIAEDSVARARLDGLGWSRWTLGGARTHQLPGSHGDLVKPPVVEKLAALLQARIDAVCPARP